MCKPQTRIRLHGVVPVVMVTAAGLLTVTARVAAGRRWRAQRPWAAAAPVQPLLLLLSYAQKDKGQPAAGV